ncbi:MAG: class II aldolase/adducin family protein [Promethearchaeota archaeon]
MKAKERDLLWSLKEEVCRIAIMMKDLGLVIGSEGNVSVRIPDKDEMLITPSLVDYDDLKPYQIARVDFEGHLIDGDWQPSSEKIMHHEVYKERGDVNAIIHTHSRYATILAVTGRNIPPLVDEMIRITGGTVELAKFGANGSKELAQNAVEALGSKKAVLLANHGVLACGKTPFEALRIAQIVEENAEIYYKALLLGEENITKVPEDVIKYQETLYKAFNRIKKKKKKKSNESDSAKAKKT